jgi:hypothetical protein
MCVAIVGKKRRVLSASSIARLKRAECKVRVLYWTM